ncbi:MAG TPA: aldolase/citrate lyase family protein [Thermoanaerobaculia bacterium]|nr:aldolase/citrate lyase family protein [Thermoanaerobaculia bacterium]
MASDTLKQRLSSGTVSIGSWISLGHPAIAEIMAKAGFDFLVIDLEHSVISIREAGDLIRIIDLCGVPCLVRTTSNDVNQIKRVMDAGAHGVIVPMVNSRADAEAAVAAVYYPNRGRRGVGLSRAQGYGVSFDRYRTWLDESAVVIVQIEHIDAVNNLESILGVAGVDGYIIGPYDLSASMSLPGKLDHPDVAAAIDRVKAVGARMNKAGGVHIVEPDQRLLNRYVDDGFRFIAYSVDFRMLDCACRAGLEAVKSRR